MKSFLKYLEEKKLATAALIGTLGGVGLGMMGKNSSEVSVSPPQTAVSTQKNIEPIVQTQEKPKTNTPPAWKPIISEFEGFSGDAYWDSKGKVWTIGKGSTTHPDGRPVRRGDSITKEQADEYMQHFVDTKITPRLQKIPTWEKMNPNQQAALTSFAYNVGPGFYGREGFETITRALKTEQGLASVPSALSLYNKSDGQTLEGLKRRRKAEGALWSTPVN